MTDHTTNNTSVKLCECGCGKPAPIANRTDRRAGCVKGQPRRYIVGHNPRPFKNPIPEIKRFWQYVQLGAIDECWIWQGHCHPRTGYGRFKLSNGKGIPAHRYSYQLAHGPIPDGLFVCHRCDVRNCVNPAHLFLGTNADNMADMVAKGRSKHPDLKGEKHGGAKLTEEQVMELRQLRATGLTWKQLGAQFGISKQHAWRIGRGENWSHLPTRP